MRLVLDTNILISALLKDSTVRRILLNPSFIFYLPEYSIEEVERHMDAIVRRSGLSEEDVRLLVRLLLTNIQVLPAEQLVEKCAEASRLLGGVDPGDTPFLALALATVNDGIWSEDTHLRRQRKVKVWRTRDLVSFAGRTRTP